MHFSYIARFIWIAIFTIAKKQRQISERRLKYAIWEKSDT